MIALLFPSIQLVTHKQHLSKDMKPEMMTRIWILIALSIGALGKEADLGDFFTGVSNEEIERSITNVLASPGLHDCYPSEFEEMYRTCKNHADTKMPLTGDQPSILRFTVTDDLGTKEKPVCCIPKGFAEPDSECGERKPDGIDSYTREAGRQKRNHARAVLLGEYPWRALIWRNDREEGPFCAGTVIGAENNVILTSANCALMYNKGQIMVTFNRTRENVLTNIRLPVKKVLVHENYQKRKPFINDIALLELDTSEMMPPAWVTPACLSNRPPMYATVCTVMSQEDYFIDSPVPMSKQCEVDNKKLDVSQLCSVTYADEFEAELGAGFFCQDHERTRTLNYYVSGITLQVRGQLVTYTNVSHFEGWIKSKMDTITPS